MDFIWGFFLSAINRMSAYIFNCLLISLCVFFVQFIKEIDQH